MHWFNTLQHYYVIDYCVCIELYYIEWHVRSFSLFKLQFYIFFSLAVHNMLSNLLLVLQDVLFSYMHVNFIRVFQRNLLVVFYNTVQLGLPVNKQILSLERGKILVSQFQMVFDD